MHSKNRLPSFSVSFSRTGIIPSSNYTNQKSRSNKKKPQNQIDVEQIKIIWRVSYNVFKYKKKKYNQLYPTNKNLNDPHSFIASMTKFITVFE